MQSLSRDGIDAVRATLKELEAHGYVTRNRLRTPEGFLSDMEYIIREIPEGESNWQRFLYGHFTMQGLPVLELQMTGESSIGKTNIGKSHAIKYLWEKELIDKGLKDKKCNR